MASYLDKVNQTKVTPESIGEVIQIVTNLAPEERGVLEVRTIQIFQLFTVNGFRGRKRNHADLAMALDLRIAALSHLLAAQEVMGWALLGIEPEQVNAHKDLVNAAAEEPLIEDASHWGCRGQRQLEPGELPNAPSCFS